MLPEVFAELKNRCFTVNEGETLAARVRWLVVDTTVAQQQEIRDTVLKCEKTQLLQTG